MIKKTPTNLFIMIVFLHLFKTKVENKLIFSCKAGSYLLKKMYNDFLENSKIISTFRFQFLIQF